jgi:hypothetical protein
MTTFIRLLDIPVDGKAAALKAAVAGDGSVFDCAPEAFAAVPGSPFAYWAGSRILRLFAAKLSGTFETKCGMGTLDDFRFLRLYWEVGETINGNEYPLFAKGGTYIAFWADVHLTVKWYLEGAEVKQFVEDKVGSASRKIQAQSYYFRPGLTWPRRTDGLSFRALPAGCIFADKGPAAFVKGDNPQDLLALSALLNSRPFGYLVGIQLARTALAQSYEVGLIQRTPVPPLTTDDGRPTTQAKALATLARRAWSLKRILDTVNETSHAFVLPPRLNDRVTGLDPAAIEQELAEIQREIDDRAFACYGIEGEERLRIESGCGGSSPGGQGSGFGVQQSQAEAPNPIGVRGSGSPGQQRQADARNPEP